GEFSVIDAETGRLLWNRGSGDKVPGVDEFTFSGDGKTLYLLSKAAASFERRETDTGKVTNKGAAPGQQSFAFSADGKRLIEVVHEGQALLWHLAKDQGNSLALGKGAARVAITPDCQYVAVAWLVVKDGGRGVTVFD